MLFTCIVISMQRFLKLKEMLELLNNLDSDENVVENAVLPWDASEATEEIKADDYDVDSLY